MGEPWDSAGIADPRWLVREEAGSFPRWQDPDCPHPPERQVRDGMGYVCMECGVIRLTWQ